MKKLLFLLFLILPFYCFGQDEVIAQFKVLALSTKIGNDEPWSAWDYSAVKKASKPIIITINTKNNIIKFTDAANTTLHITYCYPAKRSRTLTGKQTEVREIYTSDKDGKGVKIVLSIFPEDTNVVIYRESPPVLWIGYLCNVVNDNIR
jgi:hypothetical protein